MTTDAAGETARPSGRALALATAVLPMARGGLETGGGLALWLAAHGLLALWLYGQRGAPEDRKTLAWVVGLGIALRLLYAWQVPVAMPAVRLGDPYLGGVGWLMLEWFVRKPTGWVWLLAVMDCVTLIRLPGILQHWRRPTAWVAVYAWSPLVLWCGLGGRRPELVALFFVTSALVALRTNRSRHAFMALGLASCVVWPALLLAPLVARKRDLQWLILAPLLPVIAWGMLKFGPQVATNSQGYFGIWAGGDGTLEVLPVLLEPLLQGRALLLLCLGLWAVGYGFVVVLKQDAPRIAFMLGWLGLWACTPGLTPWELVPLAFVLVLAPSRTGLLLCATAGLAVFRPEGMADWLVSALAVLPVPAYGIVEGIAIRRTDGSPVPPPRSMDLIMPTLNEAASITATLDSVDAAIATARRVLGDDAPDIRLTLVDGGSTDDTVALATARGVRVITAEKRGRGNQFATGLTATEGDVVVMLHADAQMRPETLRRLVDAFHAQPGLEWGILGHVYDRRDAKMRMVEVSNRLRFHLLGLAFGDQGIFVRRDILVGPQAMPEIPLMEDVELSLRLADRPCRVSLNHGLDVSSRRWDRKGFNGYTFMVFRLVGSYLIRRRLGASPAAMAEAMYQRYYGHPSDDTDGA